MPPGPDRARPLGRELDGLVAAAAAPSPSLTVVRAWQLVTVTGAADGGEATRVAAALARALGGPPEPAAAGPRPWRVAYGRSYPGPAGVRRSYDGAGDALDVADRLGLPEAVVVAADLLLYQVLLRDRGAITDLVGALLTPLAGARGGAEPLLDTLQAYYACGGVAAEAARRLHLSARAMTYRLARIGHSPVMIPLIRPRAWRCGWRCRRQVLDWPATPLISA